MEKHIDTIIYSFEDVCPCCGRYTPDGNVCSECLRVNNIENI